MISARLLKGVAEEAAGVHRVLVVAMLAQRRWPECWRLHWVIPLFNKGSAAQTVNHRGVHLTPRYQRSLKGHLRIYVCHIGSNAGPWAQITMHTGRRRKYSFYPSDVSGAFDRVRRGRLVTKLEGTGLHPDLVGVLSS